MENTYKLSDLKSKGIKHKNTFKKEIDLAECIVILIIFLRFCYPVNALLSNGIQYVVYYGLYLIFLLLVILYMKYYLGYFIKHVWILLILMISIIIRSIFAEKTGFDFYDPMRLVIFILNMMIAYSIFIYTITRPRIFQSKVVKTALLGLSISILYSLYYVSFIDYLAVRNATSVNQGVGDFNLIYTVIFIPVICILLVKYSKLIRKREKIGLVFLYFISLLLIIKANFMTALILFVLISLISFFIGKSLSKRKKVLALLSTIIIIAVGVILRGVIGEFLFYMANKELFSWVINDKLVAMGNLFLGTNQELETFGIRIEKINFTFESFLSSPTFGINYSDYNGLIIGGHSQWFDDLARFGIVGMLFWLFFYIKVYKQSLKTSADEINKLIVTTAWVLFVLLGFLNPNNMSLLSMFLFTVIPFSSSLMSKPTQDIKIS